MFDLYPVWYERYRRFSIIASGADLNVHCGNIAAGDVGSSRLSWICVTKQTPVRHGHSAAGVHLPINANDRGDVIRRRR